MIVKNEAHCIERCLSSVNAQIDCVVIADTGSTDGTPMLIEGLLDRWKIPGMVVHIPWTNFSGARNAAIDAAVESGFPFEYILFLDADAVFQGSLPDDLPSGEKGFGIICKLDAMEYPRTAIISRTSGYRYRGAAHEVLDQGPPDGQTMKLIASCKLVEIGDGGNHQDRYRRNLELLMSDLEKETDPNWKSRSVFYIACSYSDMKEHDKADEWYRKRMDLGPGTNPEEVYFSRFQIHAYQSMNGNELDAVTGLLNLWDDYPHRAEPLYALAQHFIGRKRWKLGYLFADMAMKIQKPTAGLFVSGDVYDYKAMELKCAACCNTGRLREARELCERLVGAVPSPMKDQAMKNLENIKGVGG